MPRTKKTEPDWKEIAKGLASELLSIITHIHHDTRKGTGCWYIHGRLVHWKERAADTLETFPGVKIDREVMHANGLPKKEREKFFADRKAKKKS